uniref:DNA-directed RNA polymerase subunit beta n=1 Tax=Leersia perrieri TaxID=77586 RepID=A0A0D9X4U7_9ORYZ
MEEPQITDMQSPVVTSIEMDFMNFDDILEGNEKQSSMDVDLRVISSLKDGGHADPQVQVPADKSPMDADLGVISSLQDGGLADPQVSVEKSIANLEKLCKEASRSFFRETKLVSHQINSYNDFISHGLQKMFDSMEEVTVEPDYDPSKKAGPWRHATVKFGRVELEEPVFWVDNSDLDVETLKLKPKHARLQKMTYSSKMKVQMTVQVYSLNKSDKGKTGHDPFVQRKDIIEETKWVTIGKLPVMVKSNLCWLHKLHESECEYDFGGYFLIKGMEKVFTAEEQRCLSRIWINDHPIWEASYGSQSRREKIYVKLVQSNDGFRKVINLNFLGATIPIWIMFFALGASSDKEAFDIIDIQECDASIANIISATVIESDEQCKGFRGGEQASQYIDELIKKTKFPPKGSFSENIGKYMFPNVNGNRSKALFLGYMVRCLLMAYSGNRKCDNKDDFRNKRLDLACELLRKELWRHVMHARRRMVKFMQRHLSGDGDLQPLEHYVDASIVTNGLNRAFSTGSWCHPYIQRERCSGIVATLKRTNPLQMMSDLRKTRQWVAYAGLAGDARYPNPSYWGKLCFLTTPNDAKNCGLVKNLATTAIVSSLGREPLVDTLVSCGMKKLDELLLQEISGKDRIFLNGNFVGVCADPGEFVLKSRNVRRSKKIDPQVEIKRDRQNKEVRVFSDPGRILRPLLIVENLRKIMKRKDGSYSFQELMDQNIIELIGVEEEEDIRCACGIRHLFAGEEEKSFSFYTHCELDPSFLLGLSCSIIPFANHDSASRILMQAQKISKQAIGNFTTNPLFRVDTHSHQLYYPQRPLFKTVVADCLGRRDYTSGSKHDFSRPEYFNGQNAIVSINVHQGFNQEDSLVVNRASLERGMFRTQHFKSYKALIENKEITKRLKYKEKINFGKTPSKKGRVDSLDTDGLPYIGASLQSNDIVIGKVSESGEDHSIKLLHTEKGMVEKVVLSANDDGVNSAIVTLRQSRSPRIGDKFSSMHGQKGVIGFLDSQENFAFTHQGIVPDIVINPHSFPTRQTPGQVLEAALGKGIALGGAIRYATPFTSPSVEVITEQLHKAGFSRWGGERVINGRTGEMMSSPAFMGPTFYQRLHHMAEDKVKFRNTGPVHPLTRQPVEDRRRYGGVKFGEMERDCLLAHGAAANLHERLFLLSDLSRMHVCRRCRRFAGVVSRPTDGGKKVTGAYCGFCRSAEEVVRVSVPYGAKILYQELFSMGIILKFDTELI